MKYLTKAAGWDIWQSISKCHNIQHDYVNRDNFADWLTTITFVM